MNNRVWLYVAVSIGSVACAAQQPLPSPDDGVACTAQLPIRIVKLVYVDVAPGQNGPVVSPELCVVRSGTQVVWRTALDVQDPFALAFAESPVASANLRMSDKAAQKNFNSQRMGRRQEVQIIAKPVTSENLITYDVAIGPLHVDPGIKIMPR
ncbi:MAG: hypothetical protein ACREP4_03060 [Stenotrophomonas sp.]|uniref:hypothetical protein n=1 Tax=Stenotrophomonas sp. TaxID=69392 RepID=UPI003D6D5F3C